MDTQDLIKKVEKQINESTSNFIEITYLLDALARLAMFLDSENDDEHYYQLRAIAESASREIHNEYHRMNEFIRDLKNKALNE